MGKGLAWVSRREQILELEVAMLDEHGLIVPLGDGLAGRAGR